MCTSKLYRYFRSKYVEKESSSEPSPIERLLLNDEIYYQSPEKFNDPFDCNVVDRIHFSDESIKAYAQKCLRNIPLPPNTSADLENKIIEKTVERTKDVHVESFKVSIQNAVRNLSILCFSKLNNNILMYSHYADKHKGFCFEFTLQENNNFKPEKVEYKNSYPICELSDNPNDRRKIAKEILVTKADSWSYEEEYRIIADVRGGGYLEFPPEYLTGIIFGCRTDNKTKEKIREIVKKRTLPLKLYQATISKTRYALDIVPLS